MFYESTLSIGFVLLSWTTGYLNIYNDIKYYMFTDVALT